MSYTVAAYAVDLDQLSEVYGSHDLDLVQAIEDRFVDHIADYDEQALGHQYYWNGKPVEGS